MADSSYDIARPDALTPSEILSKTVQIGVSKATMPLPRVFVLGILAGLFIAMGAMYMLLVKSDATIPFAATQLLGALAFSLGLFLTICSGAELFTGNCLMICGRLSNKLAWSGLLKNWVVVYLGNFVGSLLMVGLLFFSDYWTVNANAVGDAMVTVAVSKIDQPWQVLLLKGVLCNFLVCLAVWIAYSGRTVVDKFFAVLLPITAFVACGFEHCVANMFFLPMGWVLKLSGFAYSGTSDMSHIGPLGILYNLSASTLGNIIGGSVMVGLAYWFVYHKRAGETR